MIKKLWKVLLLVFTLALAGCSDVRASANLTMNTDGTFYFEQVLLAPSIREDGSEEDFTGDLSTVVPRIKNQYETVKEVDYEIDGKQYKGYQMKTTLLDSKSYSQYREGATKFYFLPEITIQKFGLFRRQATVTYDNILDTLPEDASLGGSSFKVNISIPGVVVETNATSIDEENNIFTWENEDINHIKIVVRYNDFSLPIKIIKSIIYVITSFLVMLMWLVVFTKPKRKKLYY